MLLVIFGTGASYDSGADYPPNPDRPDEERPPLADELFANRLAFRQAAQKFKECQPLITRLGKPSTSVEQELEVYQANAERNAARYPQLAAVRFSLRTIIWDIEERWDKKILGVSNYKTLLDDLEAWRSARNESVFLVTFNYDRMIESVLPFSCTNIGEYVSDYRYKLVKLHGSVNWVHRVGPPLFSSGKSLTDESVTKQLIADAKSLPPFEGVETVSHSHIALRSVTLADVPGIVRLFPAIAIPVVQKSGFECPESHVAALSDALPKVTRILTVGWRGTEKHFSQFLKDHLSQMPKEIMIVAGNAAEAKKVEMNLRLAGLETTYFNSKYGFSESLKRREIDEFLLRTDSLS